SRYRRPAGFANGGRQRAAKRRRSSSLAARRRASRQAPASRAATKNERTGRPAFMRVPGWGMSAKAGGSDGGGGDRSTPLQGPSAGKVRSSRAKRTALPRQVVGSPPGAGGAAG